MTTKERAAEMAKAIAAAELEDDEDGVADYVSIPRPKSAAQVYSVRIPAEQIERLRVVAIARGVRPTTLIRDWVIERLDESSPATVERIEVVLRVERLTEKPGGYARGLADRAEAQIADALVRHGAA